jgi:hypothetical protein
MGVSVDVSVVRVRLPGCGVSPLSRWCDLRRQTFLADAPRTVRTLGVPGWAPIAAVRALRASCRLCTPPYVPSVSRPVRPPSGRRSHLSRFRGRLGYPPLSLRKLVLTASRLPA